ncbi:heme peroxidase [Hesseltinella vesiculosa]|uniref:Heme peroxidase n=1 Tax=Hesseltinella vesiculosa TaxID=101127 RepID=A0A1X2G8W4_9FUNG|nr:heme peroxidase [Hesseltinella vesiculosa]
MLTLKGNTVPTNNEKRGLFSNEERFKISRYISDIETESGLDGLINTLKDLTVHFRQGKSDKAGKKKRNTFFHLAPTPSSEPTGLAWTAQAFVKNIEALFGITPERTSAMKEVLTLPLKQQEVLFGALVERLLSKNAPTNDRNNTFEAVMNILGNLGPEKKDLVAAVTMPLIQNFYDDIKKPYINYVGKQFRSADGSGNSVAIPNVGKAGNNYVRTVSSTELVNENLPTPQQVFDRLLKRPDNEFVPHQNGINMFLFYLAIIITHDLFYTDGKDSQRNLTTSYLDLSLLYGFNREDQESVRQMKQGLLNPDQWFDKRLVVQPPGVATLLILFSRNHNYIAKNLLEKNENERFSFGPDRRLKTEKDQDEELFQTARLVNNACYVNVIIHDYVRTILGTTQDSDFVLDPFSIPSFPVNGNEVSIEFNIIYRWHAALGQKDADWLANVMQTLGEALKYKASSTDASAQQQPAKEPSAGTDQGIFSTLLPAYNDHFTKATPEELAKGLPLFGAHRNTDTGAFSDHDLATILRDGYQQVASEIGNGLATPAAFAHIEYAGIKQARDLGVCYFNEFRKYLHLLPLTSFEDFSEKPEVQQALKDLYGTPDKVELYAGAMVERSKVTGLRLPYTMGRAILSDAVNLLRNDRILTQELRPANLTNWGYQYSQGEASQHGRILPRMIQTLLPNANPDGSPAFTNDELKNLFVVPS